MLLLRKIALLCFASIFFNAYSQNIEKKINLEWTSNHTYRVNDQSSITYFYFKGAIYNDNNLPLFNDFFNVESENIVINTEIKNAIYKELNTDEIKNIEHLEDILPEIKINTRISVEKKIPFGVILFVPLRKNEKSGKIEKLISADLISSLKTIHDKTTATTFYASNSILATGNWYKFNVVEDGIYIIDFQSLVNAGIDPSTIDPRNIRIYGNGGGMLPEANTSFRYDDLVENSIFVYGQDDGVFNTGDYILFYGQSPHRWKYNSANHRYIHYTHLYSDVNSYFLSTNLGLGKRTSDRMSVNLTPTNTVNTFDDFQFWDLDSINLMKSGSVWYGKTFDIINSYSFPFSFPDRDVSQDVNMKISVAARSTATSTFNVNANGTTSSVIVGTIISGYSSEYAKASLLNTNFKSSSSAVNVTISYNKPNSTALGWLDYIELNVRRNLVNGSNQLRFRDMLSTGVGKISDFRISNMTSDVVIWDVTDPTNAKRQLFNLNSNIASFIVPSDTLHEFVAYSSSNYLRPVFSGVVSNQNLHAIGQIDMAIISPAKFLGEANRLASFHRTNDNYKVTVVSPDQIYNEFSSGAQDVGAIRAFMKMFYDRATSQTDQPKYLLLFGDGSFDNRGRMPTNTNYIPTYQSANSLNPTASFVTDDYFGMLDNSEGNSSFGLIDIGIGRFPVQKDEDAKMAVDKSIHYAAKYNLLSKATDCALSTEVSNFADWKNLICFIADDEDNGLHLNQADQIATFVDTTFTNYNIDKIYCDAYPQQTTPGGQRYPDVTNAINNRVARSAFIINYTGHGGEIGWGHERYLNISDITSWTNSYALPIFITATCEFSRFDDPDRTSAGELVFLNENGGGVCLFSTTRLVYSSSNFELNKEFNNYVFRRINGQPPALGDVMRLAKRGTDPSGTNTNNRNFTLLGDPGLKLSFPQYGVNTGVINNNPPSFSDTIKALSKVKIGGYITDENGQKKTNFNGIIYPSIYDKASTVVTLGNDPTSPKIPFKLQKNLLYKGKVSVSNGDFSFSFVVPKDISYSYGKGRISYYSENGSIDAAGNCEQFIIGGSDNTAPTDNEGPSVNLFLNNDKFAFGGVTNENPIILAILADTNGINTVGNGIGHDIVAILDGNTEKTIVLNDYYESDLNSYQKGKVRYPLKNLAEGKHNLKLKVWDTYNNSSETYTEFYVSKSQNLKIDHVLNYPNPFSTQTSFFFEHNQPCCQLEVQIKIYTIGGKLVKTIDKTVETNGFRIDPILWDGLDDYGDRIGRGVYIYYLKVKATNGSIADKYEKLVIIR